MRFSNSSISSLFFSSIIIFSFLLLMAGVVPLTALAAPTEKIGVPEWAIPTAISTDDGYADLQWVKPDGAFTELYRITESRLGSNRESYVDSPELFVYRVEPGRYDFKVAACQKDADGLPKCGGNSKNLRLTVTEEILNALQQKDSETTIDPIAMASAVAGGPDQLRPGHWYNPAKSGQGWSFWWANRLALPSGDPLFGNAYDLAGVYYTFEAKSSGAGNYRPFVAMLKAVKTATNVYSGTIYVTRSGVEYAIGSASLTFGSSNTTASVEWSINFKYEALSDVDSLVSLLGNDPAAIYGITHYSGIWEHATNSSFTVDDNIGDTTEAVEVIFYDSVGDPVWIQAVNSGTANAGNTYLCFSYLVDGYAANLDAPAGWSQVWYNSGCDSSQQASSTNRNARRDFPAFETERFWADFTLPGTAYSTGFVNIGTSSYLVNLEKKANFHGISFYYIGGDSCGMTDTTPSCTVQLTWFTDGDYPNATAYAFNKTTQVRTKILKSTEPAMENQTHVITEAGAYIFELRMGNSPYAEIIAQTGEFTVTNNLVSVPPATPGTVHGVWVNQANSQYTIEWQHADTQTVDRYEIEETLPDGTNSPLYSVSPGTNFSLYLDKSAAPQGEYQYRVRACNSFGCSGFSVTFHWFTEILTGVVVFSDDFETSKGWATNWAGTDTATQGMWERGDPEQTAYSGITYQSGTTVSGNYDLVTGAAGGSITYHEVDNGVTTITSPSFAVPTGGNTTLSFYYYLAHSMSDSYDYFRVFADTVGNDVLLLVELGNNIKTGASWIKATVDLSALAGQSIRIRFEVADNPNDDVIEAAVDDVEVRFISGNNSPTFDQTETTELTFIRDVAGFQEIRFSDPDSIDTYTCTLSSGTLPIGLVLSTDNVNRRCIISGTPTDAIKTYPINIKVSDSKNATATSPTINIKEVFQLESVTELEHIWVDENNQLFKLAWRYPEATGSSSFSTPTFFKVSPGLTQPEGTVLPPDVAVDANVGYQMWQSSAINASDYLGSTFWVAACVGEDQCGPLVAVNLQTAQAGSDLEPVSQLSSNWVNEASGTFTLSWSYNADYFASSTGKPDQFEITPSLDPGVAPIIVTVGSPTTLTWQSPTIDEDDHVGSSYIIKVCKNNGDCGSSMVMTLSRQFPEPAFPTPVWSHGNKTVNQSLQFSLNWQSAFDSRIDYFTIKEQGILGESVFYTEADSIALERAAPGNYTFWVKACDRDRENGDSCGNKSSPISVYVPSFVQMESINNLNWFWVDEANDLIGLSWQYPSGAYNDSNGRPDYFAVSFSGGLWYISFDHSVDASNGDGDYTWVSNTVDLGAVWQQGNFSVKACTNGGLCGSPVAIDPWSAPAGAPMSQSQAVQLIAQEGLASNSVPGGPDDLKPGTWWDPDRSGTGWDFFWASELRYPATHDNYGNTYDLIAFWYAYDYFAEADAWLPVWFFAELKLATDEQGLDPHFEGTLYKPTRTQDGEACDGDDRCAVGRIEVHFRSDSNTIADVSVTLNEGTKLIGPADFTLNYIGDDVGIFGDGGVENPHDHFSGVWFPADGSFGTSQWIESWFESITVLHYDEQGVPIWTRANIDGREPADRTGTNNFDEIAAVNRVHDDSITFEEGAVYTIRQGFNPMQDRPEGYALDILRQGSGGRIYEDHSVVNDAYEGHRKAGIWLSLDYSIVYGTFEREAHLNVGTITEPTVLDKWANFHDIRFFVGDNTAEVSECYLVQYAPATNGSCDLRLNWFTDSEYPNITAFSHNLTTDQYTKIASPGDGNAAYPVTVGYPFSINAAGEYQFELWKYANVDVNGIPDLALQGNAQIAISKKITVIDDDVTGVEKPADPPSVPPENPKSSVPPSTSGSSVGATAGSFRVDESGSATYTVPILTAPSTGNLRPDIALTYSSGVGNGPVGVGWQISGTSAISRCSQTLTQDLISNPSFIRGIHVSPDDRFCLDGMRLILISGEYGDDGAEYRLETDTTTRIRSYGSQGSGPKSFKVWRGNGSVSIYGDTAGALIGEQLGDYTAVGWAVYKVTDRAGNFMTFDYEDSGNDYSEHRLVGINYSDHGTLGHLTNRIEFDYGEGENRPDVKERFIAGHKFKTSMRLEKINSYGVDQPQTDPRTQNIIRSYILSYITDGKGRSALNSIKECSDSVGSVCFNQTNFDWNLSSPTFENIEQADGVFKSSVSSGNLFDPKLFDARPADINGDGRLDLVWLTCDDYNLDNRNWGSPRMYYALATNLNEFGAAQDAGVLSLTSDVNFCRPPIVGEPVQPPVWTTVDYNNDGMTDVILMETEAISRGPSGEGDFTNYLIWYGFPSNGTGFATPYPLSPHSATPVNIGFLPVVNYSNDLTSQFGDFNGDGSVDALVYSQGQLFMQLASEGNYPFKDNDPDISVPIYINVPIPVPSDSIAPTDSHSINLRFTSKKKYSTGPQVVDYNNDGAADLLVRMNWEGSDSSLWAGWVVLVSDGEGLFSEAVWARKESPGSGAIAEADVHLVDINGDSLADVVWLPPSSDLSGTSTSPDEFGYTLNKGGSFGDEKSLYVVNGQPQVLVAKPRHSKGIQFVDYDGDMDIDILFPIEDNESSKFEVLRWQGTKFASIVETTSLYSREIQSDDDQSLFIDMTGDGYIDQLLFERGGNGDLDKVEMKAGYGSADSNSGNIISDYKQERYEPQNVITKITNGFGDFVNIKYKSLTQLEVYQRENNAVMVPSETSVFDVISPYYVVSEVSTYNLVASDNDVPGNADIEAKTRYKYRGARVQTGGRGLLGFSEIIAFEVNSNVRTATRYRQDFPFIGLPFDTLRSESNLSVFETVDKCTKPTEDNPNPSNRCEDVPDWGSELPMDANLLSYTRNLWTLAPKIQDNMHTPVDNVYMPVNAESLLIKYITPGQEFSKQSVTNTHDSYGNVLTSIVTQEEYRNSDWATVSGSTTTNVFGQDSTSDTLWVLGLVTSNQQTLTRSGANARTLISKFEYKTDTVNGILEKEIIDYGGEHQVVIEYTIDSYGNHKSKTVSPTPTPDEASGTTHYTYDPLGRYPQITINAVGDTVSEIIGRDAFGNPLEIRNINDVSTYFGYDAMGRQFYSINAPGAWVQEVQILKDPNNPDTFIYQICPAQAVFATERTSSAEPTTWTCYDAQARIIRVATEGFSGEVNQVDTGFDGLGRKVFISNPYVSNGSAYYTHTNYDVYNRPTSIDHPNGLTESVSYGANLSCGGTQYLGTSVTTTNAQGTPQRTEVHDIHGNLLCVIDEENGTTTYGYDAANNINWINGPLTGNPDPDTLFINYNARGWKTSMSDPDKGDWSYEYYPTGELKKQTDGNGQVIEYTHDKLGRVTARLDKMVQPSSLDDVQTTFYEYGSDRLKELGQLRHVHICKGDTTVCSGDNQPFSQTFGFDDYGRVVTTETTIDNLGEGGYPPVKTFLTQRVYDGEGRIFQEFERYVDTYRPNTGLQYNYNTNNYLRSLQETRGSSASSTVFQEVRAMDAWGNVVESVLANGVYVFAGYSSLTGLLEGTCGTTDPGISIPICESDLVQEISYDWDVIGNLNWKHDQIRDAANNVIHEQTEDYIYDKLNRLRTVELSSPQLGLSNYATMTLEYDAAGNITQKDGVDYHYDLVNGAGPHAVSSRADGNTYYYDSNGNNTSSSDGRTITYTAFNKPSRIERDAEATEFSYGPDRNRYRRVEMSGNVVTEEAIYVGNTEIIYTNGGYSVEFRRNIGGIAIERFKPGVSLHTEYVLRDNLGSPHTLLDELGQVTYRLGFDAHGSRRQGFDPRALIEGYNPVEDVSDRGFTGHEHLDGLGVIHMNGRIYDPGLGRFLQADPLIQDLSNPQSLNRYTYVFNNPLSYTDPTGYGVFNDFIRPILTIGIAYYTGGWAAGLYQAGNIAGALAVSIGGGALAGAIATGSGEGTLIGAFTGAAAFGVGSTTAGSGWGQISNSDSKEGAKSLPGGFRYWVSGSNFSSGVFASSGIGHEHFAERRGAPITDEQRSLATAGKFIEFWNSRWRESADPVARTALIGWGRGDQVDTKWYEPYAASFTWWRMESYISKNNLAISMEELGVQLAQAHVEAVDDDDDGIAYLLSASQVTDYHYDVFKKNKIPPHIFGGTLSISIPNKAMVWSPPLWTFGPTAYSKFWCNGCDTTQ